MKRPVVRALLVLPGLLWILAGCGPGLIAPEPTLDEQVAKAKSLFERKKYFDAKERFEEIRFNYPGNARIAEVQFYLGRCNFELADYAAAQQDFRLVLRDFPGTDPVADDAMFYLCRALYQQALPARLAQDQTREALEETQAFLEAYPQSGYAADVRSLRMHCLDRMAEKEFFAGQLYRRMGYPSSAIHYFKALERDYPESRWSVRGRYEWALSYYQQKNYGDATKVADTCGLKLSHWAERERETIDRPGEPGAFSNFIHLYGVFPQDRRSELRQFLDALQEDLSELRRKIEKKRQKKKTS